MARPRNDADAATRAADALARYHRRQLVRWQRRFTERRAPMNAIELAEIANAITYHQQRAADGLQADE